MVPANLFVRYLPVFRVAFFVWLIIGICAATLSAWAQGNDPHDLDSLEEVLNDAEGEDKGGLLNQIGLYYFNRGQYSSALEYYETSLQVAQQQNDSLGMAKAYLNIGGIYNIMGKPLRAIRCLLKSVAVSEALGIKEGIGRAYNNIALIYSAQNDSEKAMDYLKKALAIADEQKQEEVSADILMNIGNVCWSQKQHNKALTYYRKARRKYQSLNDQEGISTCFLNIGVLRQEKGQHTTATEHYRKALTIARTINHQETEAYALMNLGDCYLAMNQPRQAVAFLQQAIELGEKNKIHVIRQECLLYLSQADSAHQNFASALQHYQAYIALKDSLFNAEKSQQIHELEIAYQTQQKEAENEVLKARQSLHLTVIQRQRVLMVVAGIALLIIAFLARQWWRNYHRQKGAYAVIDRQNQQLKLLDRDKNALLHLVSHDLRTPLSHMINWTNLIKEEVSHLSEKQVRYLDKVNRSARKLTDMTHQILDAERGDLPLLRQNIRPVHLPRAVTDWQQSFAEEMEKKNIAAERCFFLRTESICSEKTYLEQIFNNLMSNAIKYSPPDTTIRIVLHEDQSHVYLSIEDQGIGIAPDDRSKLYQKFQQFSTHAAPQPSFGVGLYNVKRYVTVLQGSIDCRSQVGKGTRFTVILPKELSFASTQPTTPHAKRRNH